MDDNALLVQKFEKTIKRLKRLADGYDGGSHDDALGISGLIVNLIGDRLKKNGLPSTNFVSLSQRVGRKPKEMLDLSLEPIRMSNLHGPICAMGLHVIGAKGMAPILDGPGPGRRKGRVIPFDEWWAQTIIRDGLGCEHTRQSIIETMRDQEEAHIDSELEESYGALAYGASLGITQHNPAVFPLDLNPTTVAVRQIAHEVLRAFCPDMETVFSRLSGGRIEPIALVAFFEREYGGEWREINDRGFWRYQIESTSDPAVIAQWRSQSKFANVPPLAPCAVGTERAFRLAFFNLNNVPVNDIRVSVKVGCDDSL